VVCNSGSSLVPTINGTMHHFNNVGLYDALFVMQDTETKTLWNHITGEALYGPLVGRTLGPVSNLLQMNVRQALDMDPAIQIAISNRAYFVGGRQFGTPGSISPRSSVGNPGEAFIDQVDGKKVLIYVDAETSTPAAIFVDAKKAERKGNDVRLDNGAVVRSGILLDKKGKRQNPDRPQQIFTRWYGFALTFPGSEVFGGS
jgi:hypothetical protein